MTVGVIAEFNPFHEGHEKLLKKIKEKWNDATIIVLLSGHFCQRGIPSTLDKWTKTEIALNHGADIVIELPFSFATQSADIFALGAIALLKECKIDVLAFGTESCDIEGLKVLADAQDSENFNSLVKVFLRMGYNYPTSLSLALEELTGKKFTLPNDLLAISYLKAIKKLKASFELFPIQRENNYHVKSLDISAQSSSSIRQALKDKKDLKNYLPNDVYKALLKGFILEDDYFSYLRYKIIVSPSLEIYLGVNKGLEKKLKKKILEAESYDELIHSLQTKNYTYNYISRMLLHILVGFTKEDKEKYTTLNYIRLLGFSKAGKSYLNYLKKNVSIPIISKFKREYADLLSLESKATFIYSLALPKEKTINIRKQEFGKAPIQKEE